MANILILGLGGTGFAIVNKLLEYMRVIEEKVKAGAIEFRAIDVCWEQEVERNPQIKALPEIVWPLTFPINMEWYLKELGWVPNPYIRAIHLADGTGETRVYGKVVFEFNKDQLQERLTSDMVRIFNRTGEKNFIIWLISSLGGGTGSGMFVDFALTVRKAANNYKAQAPGAHVRIFGVAILPAPISQRPVNVHYNSYAALKEIYYAMNNAPTGSEPFDLLFLNSLESAALGPTTADREALMDLMVSRAILDFFFVPIEIEKREVSPMPSGLGRVDLQDFLRPMIEFTLYKPACFGTFSVAYFYFPYDKLDKYFMSREEIERFNERIEELTKAVNEFESTIFKEYCARKIMEIRKENELNRERQKPRPSWPLSTFYDRKIKRLSSELKELKDRTEEIKTECDRRTRYIRDSLAIPLLDESRRLFDSIIKYYAEKEYVDPSGARRKDVEEEIKTIEECLARPNSISFEAPITPEEQVQSGGTMDTLATINKMLREIYADYKNLLDYVEVYKIEKPTQTKVVYQYPIKKEYIEKLYKMWKEGTLGTTTLYNVIAKMLESPDRFLEYLRERIRSLSDLVTLSLWPPKGDITCVPSRVCWVITSMENITQASAQWSRIQGDLKVALKLPENLFSPFPSPPENLGVSFCYAIAGFRPEHVVSWVRKDVESIRQAYRQLDPATRKLFHAYGLAEGIDIWEDKYDLIQEKEA